VGTARFFLDAPYVGGTLEGNNIEQLQINMRQLDCVTFVETALALHMMLQGEIHTFDVFCNLLKNIRYRSGIIDGYLSRLHYFSEWINDNVKNGILSLPEIPACRAYKPEVSFMSNNCSAYPALKNSSELCEKMATIEKQVNGLSFCYIPKEQVRNIEKNIKNGDIIAITTNIRGLDVAHVGFAAMINDRINLLHASQNERKVVENEILHDYLARHRNHSGIIVVRIE